MVATNWTIITPSRYEWERRALDFIRARFPTHDPYRRPSQQARRVGDYVLGELLADGPGYQDWLAEHTSLAGVHCRVRQYLVAQAASEEDRQRIQRVAAHEFRLLQSLEHPGILAVRDYKQHAYGPALLFHYEAQAVRLDHFLTTRGDRLTFDLR